MQGLEEAQARWHAFVTASARVLRGSLGWYVVDPEPDGDVGLFGPILSVELAYEVSVELDARRARQLQYVLEAFR